MEVFELRKEAMYEFTKLVVEEGKSKANSNYVEQCKMYINQKYNSKIYTYFLNLSIYDSISN